MQSHVLAILSFKGLIIFLVMRSNYVFQVGNAAVAYNVVFIEQLVKFVVSRKVLIN